MTTCFVKLSAAIIPGALSTIPVRREKDLGTQVIGRIPSHSIVLRIAQSPDWLFLIYQDIVGWVRLSDINAIFVLDINKDGIVTDERQVFPAFVPNTPKGFPYYAPY